MGAAVNGVFICVGASGQTYSRQCTFGDAVGTTLKFDNGAGASATSSDFATFPETVAIRDIVLGTATTPTATTFRLTLNGGPTTQLFMVPLQLTSVIQRAAINLSIPAGARLGGIMTT